MSKAGTLSLVNYESTSTPASYRTSLGTRWAEPMGGKKISDASSSSDLRKISSSESLIDGRAISLIEKLYNVFQSFSQKTILPIRLLQSSAFTSLQTQEECIWIDMSPLIARELTVDVERIGKGEPLYFEFDDELIDG